MDRRQLSFGVGLDEDSRDAVIGCALGHHTARVAIKNNDGRLHYAVVLPQAAIAGVRRYAGIAV